MILAMLAACDRDDFTFFESGFVDTTGGNGNFDLSFVVEIEQAPILRVTTPEEATVLVTWFDADGVRRLESSTPGLLHEIDLLGLPAGASIELEVTAFFTGRRGGATQGHVTYDVPLLPSWFPELLPLVESPVDGTDALLHLVSEDGVRSVLAVVRGDGEVIWTWEGFDGLVAAGSDGVRVGLLDGAVPPFTWQGSFTGLGEGRGVIAVDPLALHDVATPIDDGRMVTLERRTFVEPAWPTGEGTAPRTLADEVVRMSDASGTVRAEVAASAFWPTDRAGVGSDEVVGAGALDWTGTRAVAWSDNEVVFSLRNQDAVAKVSLAGGLRWALSPATGLPPDLAARRLAIPDRDLPIHPDGAVLGGRNADGRRLLALVDTGDGATPHLSRVAGYLVDEDALTAELLFEATGDDPVATTLGNVAFGPEGTVFASFGAIGKGAETHARVVEVDPATGAILRRLEVPAGWTVRAIAGLPPLESLGRSRSSSPTATSTY